MLQDLVRIVDLAAHHAEAALDEEHHSPVPEVDPELQVHVVVPDALEERARLEAASDQLAGDPVRVAVTIVSVLDHGRRTVAEGEDGCAQPPSVAHAIVAHGELQARPRGRSSQDREVGAVGHADIDAEPENGQSSGWLGSHDPSMNGFRRHRRAGGIGKKRR